MLIAHGYPGVIVPIGSDVDGRFDPRLSQCKQQRTADAENTE